MDLFQPVLDALYAVVVWFFEIIYGIGMLILQPLLNLFPAMGQWIQSGVSTWLSLLYYVEVANAWLPLDVGFALLGLYSGFWLIFVVGKMILKLIPFIG